MAEESKKKRGRPKKEAGRPSKEDERYKPTAGTVSRKVTAIDLLLKHRFKVKKMVEEMAEIYGTFSVHTYYLWCQKDADFMKKIQAVSRETLAPKLAEAVHDLVEDKNPKIVSDLMRIAPKAFGKFISLEETSGYEMAKEGGILWTPNDGAQTNAYFSKALEVWYGGAAGGGKTDLAIGKAITQHKRTIFFRRSYPQLKAVMERVEEITGIAVNKSNKTLRLPDGRSIEFGSMQYEADKEKYQGRPHDLNVYDEVTHLTKSQFLYTKTWNRTEDPNQRCKILCTFNPPTEPEQEWVIQYLAPWLDPTYPNPAQPGEIRFYVMDGDDMVWTDAGTKIEIDGKWLSPTPVTFVRALIEDNPFYMDTGYASQLEALPEPLRSQFRYGDFSVGRTEDEWQLFPTAEIRKAMIPALDVSKLKLIAIGIDVARGGNDKTVFACLYEGNVIQTHTFAGSETPDAQSVLARLIKFYRDTPILLVDIIGVGTAVFDLLKTKYDNVKSVNVAMGSVAKDKTGKLGFSNLRAELHWKFREDLLDGKYKLVESQALLADLAAARWRVGGFGDIKAESKDEIRKRIGRSPDESDAVLLASYYTRFLATQFFLG